MNIQQGVTVDTLALIALSIILNMGKSFLGIPSFFNTSTAKYIWDTATSVVELLVVSKQLKIEEDTLNFDSEWIPFLKEIRSFLINELGATPITKKIQNKDSRKLWELLELQQEHYREILKESCSFISSFFKENLIEEKGLIIPKKDYRKEFEKEIKELMEESSLIRWLLHNPEYNWDIKITTLYHMKRAMDYLIKSDSEESYYYPHKVRQVLLSKIYTDTKQSANSRINKNPQTLLQKIIKDISEEIGIEIPPIGKGLISSFLGDYKKLFETIKKLRKYLEKDGFYNITSLSDITLFMKESKEYFYKYLSNRREKSIFKELTISLPIPQISISVSLEYIRKPFKRKEYYWLRHYTEAIGMKLK